MQLRQFDALFISEDPIGWASGQTNNYAYVGGNPIQFVDPQGNASWQGALGGGFLGGIANGVSYHAQGCDFGKGFENGFLGGAIAGGFGNKLSLVAGLALTEYLNQKDGVLNVPDPKNTSGQNLTDSQQSWLWAAGPGLVLGMLGFKMSPGVGGAFGIGGGGLLTAVQSIGTSINGPAPPASCQ